jgi:ribosome-associated heat shock protein Hsp15
MRDAGIRIDKWLWFARFFKSRTLAARMVAEGHVRLNRERVTKSHGAVRPGDVLTFPQGHDIRVVRVLGCGTRRGPAPEARLLYEDLSTPKVATAVPEAAPRDPGSGRPTKAERRALDALRERADGL